MRARPATSSPSDTRIRAAELISPQVISAPGASRAIRPQTGPSAACTDTASSPTSSHPTTQSHQGGHSRSSYVVAGCMGPRVAFRSFHAVG